MKAKQNILVSQIHGYGTYARGVMLETLQNLINEFPDSNIYYLSCSNSFNVCHVNLEMKPEICFLCKKGIQKGLKLIVGEFIHITIEEIVNETDLETAADFIKKNTDFSTNYLFDGYPVGEAAISSYISKSRDRNLVNVGQSNVSHLIESDIAFYLGLSRLFDQKKFYKVYNFNGRNTFQKTVMFIALNNGIKCINKEVVRPGGYLATYPNVLPHNIGFRKNIVENNWKNSSLQEEDKRSIGASFFDMKMKGEKLNGRVFTQAQIKNNLPDAIDLSKRVFVLFTSSDDEFAAVGEEYKNPFFKDQNEGIQYVTDIVRNLPEVILIIRMHPNLSGVKYDYVEKLRSIGDDAENIFVVHPESSVDSYALLNIAEKVLVFGSTIGIEANFWEKPVILLGKSFYGSLDIAYTPQNKEEINTLLRNILIPKNSDDALKLGFYSIKGGEKAKYYSHDISKKVFFKDKQLYKYSFFENLKAWFIKRFYKEFGIRLFVK